MKKSYILAAAIAASSLSFAQDDSNILHFESFDLGENLFYNGSDEAGNIVINEISLSNIYTPAYYSWMGFSISKVADNTTAGYGNQYASFAGAGAEGSEKYAVFYQEGEIVFANNRIPKSVQISNTTYAALTMRDGDMFTKAFGSPLDILGNPDGTNGEDWFKLQIFLKDENDQVVGDTVDVYLADYRFENDEDDYILDSWKTVELPNIEAKKIGFKLSSSDNGEWGMNTPAYFALDNLVSEPTLHVSSAQQVNFVLSPNPATDQLQIICDNSVSVTIMNQVGQVVKSLLIEDATPISLTDLPAGIYQVVAQSAGRIATQKLVIRN